MSTIEQLKADIVALSNWCEDHHRTEMGWDVKYQSLIDKRHELSQLQAKSHTIPTSLPSKTTINQKLNETQEHLINTFKQYDTNTQTTTA